VPLSREPVALGWDLRRNGSERKGVIRQEAKQGYPVTSVSNTQRNAHLDPKTCCRCFSYSFLEVRRETRGGKKITPTQETERGLMPRADRKARTLQPLPNWLSSLAQASAPHAVRGFRTSATLDKPLIRECLFYPFHQRLWTLTGQWLVCRADASPTEDPDTASL
jgi:hypothetical protein